MSSAKFLGWDYASQGGGWARKFGGLGWYMTDGSFVLRSKLPAFISSITVATGSVFRDPRPGAGDLRLLDAPPTVGGTTSCQWYDATAVLIDLVATDSTPYQLSAYGCVFDTVGRRARYQILDPGAGGAVLASADMQTEYATRGVWGRFLVSGTIRISASPLAGINPAINGLLFDRWQADFSGPPPVNAVGSFSR